MTKYIFVTGGVVSGIGKGITVASLGVLLKARGFKIGLLKLNPTHTVIPPVGAVKPNWCGKSPMNGISLWIRESQLYAQE